MLVNWLKQIIYLYEACFLDDENTNLTDVYDMLNQMSQKLDETVQHLEEAKQRQLETEKELNATKTRQLEAENDLNKTRELLKIGREFTKCMRL